MSRALKVLLIALLVWPALSAGQTDESTRLQDLLAQAKDAQQKNDLSLAADCYKQAIRLQPGMSELWANLGVMQYETGDSTDAIASLTQARRLNPALFVPDLFLGLSYLRIEQPSRAVAYLAKAAAKNSSDPQVHLALGQAYTKLADFLSAVRAYSDAARIDPQSGPAWFGLGISSLKLVERDSRTLSEVDRNSPFAQSLLAESLVRQRRYREAEAVYKELLLQAQKPPCAHFHLGLLYLKQEETVEAKSEFLADENSAAACGLSDLGLTGLLIGSGAYDEALERLLNLWSRDTGLVSAHFGEVTEVIPREKVIAFEEFLSARRSENSLDDGLIHALFAPIRKGFAKPAPHLSASSATGSAEAAVREAKQYYAAGHYGQCAQRLAGFLNAADPKGLALEATCSLLAGRYDLASQASSAWLSKMRTDPAALYWSIQANQKLSADAFARFEEIDPNSARTHILLGDVYRQRQRYENAEAEYGKVLTQDPQDFAALYGLAWAYRLNSRLEDAKSTCTKALALRPDDPETNLLMGEILVSLYEYAGAESYVRKGLDSKPQMRPHAHALLGKICAEAGRTSEAIAEMQLGLESDEDGSLHYQLAMLFRKTGNMTASASMMQQSKALSHARDKRAEIAVGGVSAGTNDDNEP